MLFVSFDNLPRASARLMNSLSFYYSNLVKGNHHVKSQRQHDGRGGESNGRNRGLSPRPSSNDLLGNLFFWL